MRACRLWRRRSTKHCERNTSAALHPALKPVGFPYRGVRGTDFTSTCISNARLHAVDVIDWQMHAHIRQLFQRISLRRRHSQGMSESG